MNDNRAKKHQGRAYLLTFICMITLAILIFLLLNPPQGMAALYLIMPSGIVAIIHLVLGPAAVYFALKTKNHWRNSWIYLYFTALLVFVLIQSGLTGEIRHRAADKVEILLNRDEATLFAAIKSKDIVAVKQVIAAGAKLSCCFENNRKLRGFSPLQYSFFCGTPQITHILLEAGADPRFSCTDANRHNHDPIVLAAQAQDMQALEFMLENNVPFTRPDGSYALLARAIAGPRFTVDSCNPRNRYRRKVPPSQQTMLMAKLLLKHGAPLEECFNEATALHWAVASNDCALVDLLLQAGANPDAPCTKATCRFSPLLTAIKFQYPKMVERLLNNRPPPDIRGNAGFQALITAARLNDNHSVDLIVKAGFRLKSNADNQSNVCYADVDAILYRAIRRNEYSVINALLAAGLDINRPIKIPGLSPRPIIFMVADDMEKLKRVVAWGGDVNCVDAHGNTVLHYLAGCRGCAAPVAAMSNLIQLGATINTVNDRGDTPLQTAIAAGHIDVQQFLLAQSKQASGTGSEQ